MLDAFVDGLDLEALSFTRSMPASTGRPGYDPRDLLKLYVYGYANQIRSSRRLMRECRRNLEVIFLLRGLVLDFRTIADFRKENAEALKRVFQVFTKVCVELDLYKQVLLAVDGTKVRAVNSKSNCYTTDVLLKKIATIDAHISNYMAAMDELDQTEEDESSCIRERLQEILDDFHARKERYCLMNGNIPHVALKYDKEARVFSLPYREADITDTLRARTDPEAIRTCLHAGVLPLAYEDKGISIEVQSG